MPQDLEVPEVDEIFTEDSIESEPDQLKEDEFILSQPQEDISSSDDEEKANEFVQMPLKFEDEAEIEEIKPRK